MSTVYAHRVPKSTIFIRKCYKMSVIFRWWRWNIIAQEGIPIKILGTIYNLTPNLKRRFAETKIIVNYP